MKFLLTLFVSFVVAQTTEVQIAADILEKWKVNGRNDWNSGNVCNSGFITCDDSKIEVIAMQIFMNKITKNKNIPSEIGKLKNLVTLYFPLKN